MWLRIVLLLSLSLGAGRAHAQEPVLLELFTSQGCSSCPPADRYLAELSDREDVVALAFHVDYWNHLGWVDPLASSKWSARQRAYGFRLYTPQLVIGGLDHAVGSRRRVVQAKIDAARSRLRGSVRASYRVEAGHVRVDARVEGARGTVYAALFERRMSTLVPRGENAGRKLEEIHIVRTMVTLGRTNGRKATLTGRLQHRTDSLSGIGVAVFVQAQGSNVVPAAAYARPAVMSKEGSAARDNAPTSTRVR